MGLLTAELRKIQMVVFDRFMRSSDNPDEARLLAEASKQIPKDRRVVIVDSDLAYGNARALALDLNKVLDEEELLTGGSKNSTIASFVSSGNGSEEKGDE
jgi:hypothetical protein